MSSPLAPCTPTGSFGRDARPRNKLSEQASIDVLRRRPEDSSSPRIRPTRSGPILSANTASSSGVDGDMFHARAHPSSQRVPSGRPRRSASLASVGSLPELASAPARTGTPPLLLTPSKTRKPVRDRHRLQVPWLQSPEGAIVFVALGLRLLLLPSYHSTDMEVHRNWLAITHSLPLSEWYFDAGSEWTLDYPPFFAWFQWLLAQPARFLCPELLRLDNLNYAAWPAKLYLRSTVIVSELVYVGAVWALARPPSKDAEPDGLEDPEPAPAVQPNNNAPSGILIQNQIVREARWTPEERRGIRLALFASLLLHPGLIFVDHIHFQYNGFLFGILFWSFWAARERRPHLCAFLFSSLLNFKHIYLYMAPAYFVFLLRSYVVPVGSSLRSFVGVAERLLIVAFFTLLPIVLSLTPLALSGLNKGGEGSAYPFRSPVEEIQQLLSRMFPFGRGLTHAYWAPNVWAGYTALDRALLALFRMVPHLADVAIASVPLLGSHVASAKERGFIVPAASRGLVGDVAFGVLPNVTPGSCALLTLGASVPALCMLACRPTYISFLHTVVLCAGASFAFGWHVHEKAVLLLTLPATYLAPLSSEHAAVFSTLAAAGTVSLLPLLIRGAETGAALALSALWLLLEGAALCRYTATNMLVSNVRLVANAVRHAYLLGLIPVTLYGHLLHPFVFGDRMPFLPLLLISVYTAAGVLGSYLTLYWLYLSGAGQPSSAPPHPPPGSASSVHTSHKSPAKASVLSHTL